MAGDSWNVGVSSVIYNSNNLGSSHSNTTKSLTNTPLYQDLYACLEKDRVEKEAKEIK